MRSPGQLLSLTSLRGIAAWWVVFFHFKMALPLAADHPAMQLIGKGYLAVDFFFVLSGFVIFINYESLFRPRSFSLGNLVQFASRRLARIYPLHITILALYLVNPISIMLFSSAKSLGDQYDPGYFIASVFLVQNWGFFPALDWNIPAWSVSTEIAAYLLFPLCMLLLHRLSSSVHRHFLAGVVALLGLAGLFAGLGVPSLGDEIARLGVFRCIMEFFLGTLAGSLYMHHSQWLTRCRRHFLVAAISVGMVGIWSGSSDFLFVPLCFWLLIIYFAGADGEGLAWLKVAPLVFLGEISYSTYLIHFFVKDWVKFFSAGIGLPQFIIYTLSVLPASVFLYRVVEKPGRVWLSGRLAMSFAAQRP